MKQPHGCINMVAIQMSKDRNADTIPGCHITFTSLKRAILFWVLMLLLTLLFFEGTQTDQQLQKTYYNENTGQWLVNRSDTTLKVIFYKTPKTVVIIFGVCCLVLLLVSPFTSCSPSRKRFLVLVTAALVVIPLLTNICKKLTNVQCPYNLIDYGGKHPYEHTIIRSHHKSHTQSEGRGFPGGHSTVGFSLMILGFTGQTQCTRLAGFTFAVILGWTLGGYQMLKGAHFLSHTIVAAQASWILILLIVAGYGKYCVKNDLHHLKRKNSTT